MKRLVWSLFTLEALFASLLCGQIGNIVVTSGASFQPGLPQLGSIGTIFCTGLSIQGVVSARDLPLPTSLAGVTVTVGGAAAPLFAVADLGSFQQINFQVPLEAVSDQIAVSQNGLQATMTPALTLNVAGDFFRIGGTRYGIFQHGADYSLVTQDNPARGGETIIAYATGLSAAYPAVPTGQPAPLSPLSHVPQSIDTAQLGYDIEQTGLSVNGIAVFDPPPISGDSTGKQPIPFMGLTPGAVGLYQINFTFPSGVSAGDATIQLVRHTCPGGGSISCNRPENIRTYLSQPVSIPVR
jgi:uncharacterized protein (TIGR03437 family)